MSGGGLFQSGAWFELLREHGFATPPEVLHCPLPAGGSLPLMRAPGGRGLLSLSNYYSGLYGPLPAVAGALSANVSQALRGLQAGGSLRLQPLDADAPWLAALEHELRSNGWWTSRFFAFANWYQPVPAGGFDAYWAARPSPLRHSVERGQRRLQRAGAWRIDIHTHPGLALNEAARAYADVYAQSWKQAEQPAGFVPALIQRAAEQGWLRLGVLWLDGRPLAAQLWLVQGGSACIFKLAYVEGTQKLSPGSVLTAALMRRAMDVDRVQEVDYLSGDDAYKADWMALRRERVGLLAFDQGHPMGWVQAARHGLGRLRSRWRNGR
jgi:hypothetical protein